MSTVRLQVQVERQKLDQLIADVKKIEISPIKIEVSGVDGSLKDLAKLASSTAKLTAEARKSVDVQNRSITATAKQTNAEARLIAAKQQLAIEEQKTRTQAEKTNTALAQQAVESEKTRTQAEKTNTALAQQAVESEKTRTQIEKTNTVLARQNEETQNVTKSASLFGDAWTRIKYYAIYASISSVTGALREALDTMKAVDDELVVVRKVTGASADEINKIEADAYKIASEYGTKADAFLESVAAFTRAGYKEQSEALAELSTKAQIVGDTTADVANQYLISVDAAYKYQGQVEALSRVLDGANEIDNKYATSIEKIASGMGKVAPIASQAHVGVNELTAAIGTITAVTQRSGEEAATALRALFLNIIGDTKTEVEDGVTWTIGEIEGLRDVIKQYAPEAYKAAEATGSVINPMKAIGGLAQSMKDGVLTEAKLMEMVSDIGGKLRTAQLLALVQNWDMYQSMLEDYGNALGSADKEVSNALDSWTRKQAQLSNQWAEFVQKTVDSDFIKWVLDAATAALDFADNIGLAAAAGAGLLLIFKGNKIVDTFATGISNLSGAFIKNAAAAEGAAAATGAVSAAATTALGFIGVATTAVSLGVMLYKNHKEALREDTEEVIEAAEKTREQSEALLDLKKKMDAGQAASDELKTAFSEQLQQMGYTENGVESLIERYGSLENAIRGVTEAQLEQAYSDTYNARLAQEKLIENSEGAGWKNTKLSYGQARLEMLHPEVAEAFSEYFSSNPNLKVGKGIEGRSGKELTVIETATHDFKDIYEYYKGITELYQRLLELQSEGRDYQGEDFFIAIQEDVLALKPLFDEWEKLADDEAKSAFFKDFGDYALESSEDLAKFTEAVKDSSKYSDEMKESLISLGQEAYSAYKTAQSSAESAQSAAEKYGNAIDSLGSKQQSAFAVFSDVKESLGSVVKAIQELDSEGAISESTIEDLIELYPELADKVELTSNGFVIAKEALTELIEAKRAMYTADTSEAATAAESLVNAQALEAAGYDSTTMSITAQLKAMRTLLLAKKKLTEDSPNKFLADIASDTSEGISPTTGRIDSQIDEIDKLLKELDGDRVKDFNTSVEQLFKTYSSKSKSSGSATDTELSRLENIVALRKSELTLLEKKGASQEEQLAKMREIQNAINAEKSYLESIGGSQEDINALAAEWYDWNAKINDLIESEAESLKKLQEDLQNELESAVNSELERAKDLADEQIEQLEKQLDSLEDLRNSRNEALDAELEGQKQLFDSRMSAIEAEEEALKTAKEEKENQLELEERILAVKEAEDALEKARRERTVRYYNSDTKQWEWRADEVNVKSAEDALEQAKEDLESYRAELAYNAALQAIEDKKIAVQAAYDAIESSIKKQKSAIDAEYDAAKREIERKKDLINSQYNALSSQWQSAVDSLQAPTRSITAILQDIATYGTPLMRQNIDNVNQLLSSLGSFLSGTLGVSTAGFSSPWVGGNSYYSPYSPPGSDFEIVDDDPIIESAGSNQYYTQDMIDLARRVIRGEFGNGSARRRAIEALGYDYEIIREIVNKMLNGQVFDSGGVLKGIGGIKATAKDEIVLPPDISKSLLSPTASSTFLQRLSELNLMYGSPEKSLSRIMGKSEENIGTQYKGSVYQFGNITLSEGQAKTLTLYDLVRLTGNLALYKNQ